MDLAMSLAGIKYGDPGTWPILTSNGRVKGQKKQCQYCKNDPSYHKLPFF
jgi:hypothetical protein